MEVLLECSQVAFEGRTVEVPDEAGIYLFSSRRTDEMLYAGQTKKGIKSRLIDHWDGAASSDLARKLIMERVVENISESRAWIKNNVSVRWIVGDDLGDSVQWAEHFAIAVLRPKLNR